ncbi:hypothetical protein, partial [Bradyrhizobium sp. NBAIM08]|uniref:hypothetical protein n=1 Tax=Bradyrhizobium sp. NBAIM08 TaxID=2793815 RepID=UPI0034D1C56F
MRHLERVRNRLPVVDGTLIQHGSEQGAPGTLSERSMVGVLVSGLRISAGDASRRVRAAETPRRTTFPARRAPAADPRPPRPGATRWTGDTGAGRTDRRRSAQGRPLRSGRCRRRRGAG